MTGNARTYPKLLVVCGVIIVQIARISGGSERRCRGDKLAHPPNCHNNRYKNNSEQNSQVDLVVTYLPCCTLVDAQEAYPPYEYMAASLHADN